MLNSIRHNIYMFLLLLCIFIMLGVIIFYTNTIVRQHLNAYSDIVELNNQLSLFFLEEKKTLGDKQAFSLLRDRQVQFFKKCTTCHKTRTDLPEKRLEALKLQQNIVLDITMLRKKTQKVLGKLFYSVQAMHDHHVQFMRKFLGDIHNSKHHAGKEEFQPIDDEDINLEPNLIEDAVNIQHQVNNIIYDYNTLSSSMSLDDVESSFRSHIQSFENTLLIFKKNSLVSNDRVLVEELLVTGKALKEYFYTLLDLEKKKRAVWSNLVDNKNALYSTFLKIKKTSYQQQITLTERIDRMDKYLLFIGGVLVLLFFLRARNLLKSVDNLVDETRKISADITYQIPEQKSRLSEFVLISTALNTMTTKLNQQVTTLTKEVNTRRRIEGLLKKEKKQWELTYNAVPDIIFITDKDDRILRINTAMAELVNVPVSEIVGKRCYEVFSDSHENTDNCRLCQQQKKHAEECDKKEQQPQLSIELFGRFFSVVISPLFDSEGKLTGYVRLMHDVSRHRQAELEKQKTALYLDSILTSSTHTAIIATDTDLCFQYFNPEAERIFHVLSKNVLGLSVHDAYQQYVPDKPINNYLPALLFEKQDAIRQGEIQYFSFKIHNAVIDASLSAIHDQKGVFSGFLFMARDITDKVRAREKEVQMIDRLQKAEKMEVIGLMAGGVAHDLNNVLSGIINYPELMLLQMDDDDKWKHYLEAIRDSGLRAAAIVSDLLTIARGAACTKENASINELIERYFESPEFKLLRSRHSGVKVHPVLADDLHECCCSTIHIQKMLMNLMTNAFEAIVKDHGIIQIITENYSIDAQSAESEDLPPGDYLKIAISDNGKGVDDQDLKHLFEPFYSRKITGNSGTGLGLAVVWNTVQDHHGRITVDSRPNEGTVFTVLLPASHSVEKHLQENSEIENLSGSGKVLVVDDESVQRDVTQKMLNSLGYSTTCVKNGSEALEYLQDKSVDLVVLDMVMEPEMNGRRTLEEILKMRPLQKTLIASGFAADKEVKRACELGKTTLIKKPFTLQKIGMAVKTALAG